MFFVEYYDASKGERDFEMQKLNLIESIDTALLKLENWLKFLLRSNKG